jgi:hypothetical protein
MGEFPQHCSQRRANEPASERIVPQAVNGIIAHHNRRYKKRIDALRE